MNKSLFSRTADESNPLFYVIINPNSMHHIITKNRFCNRIALLNSQLKFRNRTAAIEICFILNG